MYLKSESKQLHTSDFDQSFWRVYSTRVPLSANCPVTSHTLHHGWVFAMTKYFCQDGGKKNPVKTMVITGTNRNKLRLA